MLTDKKKAAIQRRLSENAPYLTPGEWYHEDVPVLLRELDYWKVRAEDEADTINILQSTFKDGMTIANEWMAKYKALENAVKNRISFCHMCIHLKNGYRGEKCFNECLDLNIHAKSKKYINYESHDYCNLIIDDSMQKYPCWQFDQERFTDRPPTSEVERKGSDGL